MWNRVLNFTGICRQGELSVLPMCGHNTYEHQPEEYVHVILGFLGRHMKENE